MLAPSNNKTTLSVDLGSLPVDLISQEQIREKTGQMRENHCVFL
jgi:hypothetical protein